MVKKIKLEFVFDYWKDINSMIFDMIVTVDDMFIFDGFCTYDCRLGNHKIDDKLIFMLNEIGVIKEVIEYGLDCKDYEFEVERSSIFEREEKIEFKDIVLDENYDYSWDREEEEEVIETYPNRVFKFE